MSAATLKNRLDRLETASTDSVYRIADLPALCQRLPLVDLETNTGGSPALQDGPAPTQGVVGAAGRCHI